uniref:NADH dehydrogenase subunit 2 n=1 Tax=Tropilaelaps mercedesae TaxID=418985 RepID=UPI0028D42FEC|nr:NADH dehydrogenase subunit 2 [Tropilaelaps mercedesae]WMV02024.1 NADH dehydrogenase subunit 2 [Tropilaelaps mercedesae]
MFFSWLKIMSFSIIIMSIIMSMSSDSWFSMWISLEINMLNFIFFCYSPPSYSSFNSMMKYFIIQSLSSMMLMFSFIISKNMCFFEMMNFITPLIMTIKLGLFPFHFWLSDVGESLEWLNFILFNTSQKFIPLYILSFNYMFNIFLLIITTNSLWSSISLFNQTSMRKMLIFSSLNHMSWITFMMLNKSLNWMIYFFIYSINFLFIYNITKNMNLNSISSISMSKKNLKMKFSISMLNFSGTPPLMGFFPKWMAIMNFNLSNMIILMTLLMSSILSNFIYIHFFIQTFSLKKIHHMPSHSNSMHYITFFLILINLPLMFMMF